jgi:CRP-like cAMP-binding protein
LAFDSSALVDLYDRITPFRFLTEAAKGRVCEASVRYPVAAGTTIIRQGDPEDRWVYLIESGSVEVIHRHGGSPTILERIEPLHYFGEWETIFDEPRQREIRADSDCLLIRFPGEVLKSLFETEPRFSQAFGAILRTKQRIFDAFDRFEVEVMRGVAQGYVNVPRLLEFYRDLQPALHPFLESQEIDLAALRYAVRRLPENLTRTFVFRLADELSELWTEAPAGEEGGFGHLRPVATQARRREVFESMPGQNLVMLRDGSSDLLDLVSLLCLYGTEAAKLRRRLLSGDLGATEKSRLTEVWGDEVDTRLDEIVKHREQFSVYVQPQRSRYRERRSERWLTQIADATETALGYSPFRLSPEVEVHIISSNTHSVSNCINPWFAEHLGEVEAWAGGAGPAEESVRRRNSGYSKLRLYFREHPEAAAAFHDSARDAGIVTLADTASTGIQVQLIDSRKIDLSCIDPGISVSGDGKHKLLVNIDYAFGEQAEFVMKHLILLFGRNIQSINFFGKAGSLQGTRGDLLAPTAFLEQKNDRYLPAERPEGRIPKTIEGHRVHSGPMLTVDGTLLQNRRMIHYYQRVWGCIGIEMEGAHYLRQVIEARELGILPKNTEGRYLYYVSDLPLRHNDSLARPLSPEEGVPPLYAITRHILSRIL